VGEKVELARIEAYWSEETDVGRIYNREVSMEMGSFRYFFNMI